MQTAWSDLLIRGVRQSTDALRATVSEQVDYYPYLTILDKSARVVPFTPNRVQLQFRANRTGRDLVLKARQHGMSTEIQAEMFLEEITRRVRTATLAHDDAGTAFLRRMADRFWLGLPDDLRPKRGLDNATTTTYATTLSEAFIATAGGKNKGRAGTYNMVHGSEVAFWADADAIMAGLMQGVPTDGTIILESTPNGAQGWFYERCMEALDGDSDWTLHFFPWWWGEDYQLPVAEPLKYTDEEALLVAKHGLIPEQIQWRRKKIRELTARLFAQEYPEDPRACFLASGNGYFADIDLSTVLTAPYAEPSRNRRIVGGLDFGQSSDFTVLSLGDADSLQEVALTRVNRLPWSEIRQRIVDECVKWNVGTLYPEWNSIGGPNIDELRKEFAARGHRIAIVAFKTTPQSKPPLITGFHHALGEAGLKLLPDSVGRHELTAFTASQTPSGAWKYEGLPHDDTVIARAIMWHAIAGGSRLSVGAAPDVLQDFFGGYG